MSSHTASETQARNEAGEPLIRTERRGAITIIELNRPEARNAMNVAMLREFSRAYTEFENDPEARCAVVHAAGKHFSLGLDLEDVAGYLREHKGLPMGLEDVDPWDVTGRRRKKPIVCAVHGFCFTLGIELCLASDVRLAARGTRFAQVEVQRGIMPFGGATLRFVQCAGYGNAMRFILTGDPFDADEALRLGVVQEVVEKKALLERALELAESIAKQAPLAVQAARTSAHRGLDEGFAAAAGDLLPETLRLMDTEDAAEGVRSFVEKREANFQGR